MPIDDTYLMDYERRKRENSNVPYVINPKIKEVLDSVCVGWEDVWPFCPPKRTEDDGEDN